MMPFGSPHRQCQSPQCRPSRARFQTPAGSASEPNIQNTEKQHEPVHRRIVILKWEQRKKRRASG